MSPVSCSVRLLAKAGADFAICPDNSAHLAWDHVQAATPIPWLHIATIVGEEAARRGFRRVGILGTRYTMGGPADFETVDRIIFAELVDGVFRDESPLPTLDSTRLLARGAVIEALR